ncbi:MAG: 1L-myo-inositol 1-phosphate cytidylyltransferase / CDP-L-myo-inositol myo-inositolphosphotransferase [Verrucomicrobiota bacterium]|jgi:CDP-L-myo-inositol myo-inositolphosphotransferase
MSKPQDGFVSRFLNRPISRFITRFLLKLPIHPDLWTLSIFILPIFCCFFLVRGDYSSIVIGAVLFQLYSILDGCDGEIARAKNLESKRGEFLDHFCDLLGSLLFVIALGFGLHRSAEGIVCAILIAANELFLRIGQSAGSPTSAASDAAYYPRHREMIERSGLHNLGPLIRWIAQLTRRDVATLLFLLLAIVDLAPWILHLWALFTAGSLIFSGLALAKPRR